MGQHGRWSNMSIVKTNKIQTLDGTTYNTPIQIVKSSLGDNLGTTSNDLTNDNPSWAFSSTTTTWTDTNNLQLTITPKFANSLIKLELSMFVHNGGTDKAAAIRVIRGTTVLFRPVYNTTGPFSLAYGSSARHDHVALTFFDTPNTTTPVTYRLQYRTYNGGTASHFFSYSAASHWAPYNVLVATEIAQ